MKKPKDRLLRPNQVMGPEWLNCNRSHVYDLCRKGKLKALLLGEDKGLRILESSVQEFINQRIENFWDKQLGLSTTEPEDKNYP